MTHAAIQQIVTGGVQTLFVLTATMTRPPHMRPAWQFTDEDVKAATDHYVRWLETMAPEKLLNLSKYMDPILGTVQLWALYNLAKHKEIELDAYYASLVSQTEGPHGGNGGAPGKPTSAAHPEQNGGAPVRSGTTDGRPPIGASISPSLLKQNQNP